MYANGHYASRAPEEGETVAVRTNDGQGGRISCP